MAKRKTLGYTICKPIRKGGNAKVYLAKKDNQKVALKVLHKNSNNNKIQRFKDEIQTVQSVQNKVSGILPILDCSLPNAKGRYWYTMPLAIPLLDKIKDSTVDEKVEAIIKLAQTMALLHNKNIVHRDIKGSSRNLVDMLVFHPSKCHNYRHATSPPLHHSPKLRVLLALCVPLEPYPQLIIQHSGLSTPRVPLIRTCSNID